MAFAKSQRNSFSRRFQSTMTRALATLLLAVLTNGLISTTNAQEIAIPTEKPELVLDLPKSSNVPAGFENLTQEQTTLVDVYYDGRFVASQLATFTNDQITFSNPASLVVAIPTVLDPIAVEQALSLPQATHVEFLCYFETQKNCGVLETEIAGVIFDEGRFRADLFINSAYLSVQSTNLNKYLPASDSGWSWLQTINTAYSGSREADDETYTVNSGTTFAYGENRLQINSNFQDEGVNNIDTFAFRRDWRGMEYQLGDFRSNSGNFQFMSDTPLRGVRIASSLDTREDLRQATGNELQVFLRSRSEVSLFKDGRLVSSQNYDAGNQILDTTQLPGGAYDVDIQIRDSAGTVTTETRFYIKSSQLPPVDQALYFLEAGKILANQSENNGFADDTGIALLRGGYNWRFSDQFGFLIGGSIIEDNASMELGLTRLTRNSDFTLGAFVGDDNRRGARFDIRTRFKNYFFSANYRRIWNDEFVAEDETDFFGQSVTQAGVSASTVLPFGRLEVSGRVNRRDIDRVETYSARYELPRLRLGRSDVFMGVELTKEEDNRLGLFTLEWRLNGDHLTSQIRPEYRYDDLASDDYDLQTNAVLSWRDGDILPDKDLRLDLRAQDSELQRNYGAEIDFSGRAGRLRLQAERLDNNGVKTTRYNGNGFTSFMLNSNAAKLGGREQTQSALIIEIEGDVDDAVFNILVNGTVRASTIANSAIAINLRPFESYNVTLQQEGASFVEFEQAPKKVTLYPGNVVTLNWEVAELDVVFGRILDDEGKPITNALVKGVSGLATTDDYGLFQAELARGKSTLQVETMSERCEITLPPYESKRGIGKLGNLRCSLTAK